MSQWTPGCFHNDEMVPVPGCSPNQNSYGCHGYIPPAETVASSSGCPSVYYNPQCTPGKNIHLLDFFDFAQLYD